MQKHVGELMDLFFEKGLYPTEWVDGIENRYYEGIPPLEAFHSQLTQTRAFYKMTVMMTRAMG